MTFPSASLDKTLRIYLALTQYPVLSIQIRARMRRALFERGVITQAAFEADVRERALRSQVREAVHDPYTEESAEIWDLRQTNIREYLTDFYFANNLPYELFEQIVRQALTERGVPPEALRVSFNPELAPQYMLFEQAAAIEAMSPDERRQAEHRLREIKVVLIRTLISDQLAYVKIAKEWLTIDDLRDIRQRKIGGGKIGGKAAGMLLARRILEAVASDDVRQHLSIPESYYLGADVTYQFMALNGLMHWNDQKYKNEDQIRQEYPSIQQDFSAGEFPPDTHEALCNLLERVGAQPLIVRSSSLLEDNFGTSFAGKYESLFCPNQGSEEENLRDLTRAIQRIYASIFNPDALTYRRSKGLQDYDERMAILIQVVEGERFGRYFLPQGAGVAFSRNQFRWSPQIRREDGFVRLVWGLGTRAVDRVGNDYPRLVALSHPLLHPQASPRLVRRYSQHYVDVIDLEENTFTSLPVSQVLSSRYTALRYIAQIEQDDYLAPIRTSLVDGSTSQFVITYDELFRRTSAARRMREILKTLEAHYESPVDTEFTLQVQDPFSPTPEVDICLLQCRPQSHLKEDLVSLPASINPVDVVFSTCRVVPEGRVPAIHYVLFVSPENYFSLPSQAERTKLGRTVGLLNSKLAGYSFICVGPGRWGTTNPDLGVPLGYGDIYNARALVEVSGQDIGLAPEPSFGTHFFQDLIESNIYPLAVYLDDEDTVFNRDFFYHTPNQLQAHLPDAIELEDTLRLIEVASYRPDYHLELIMDDEKGQAVAFLVSDE